MKAMKGSVRGESSVWRDDFIARRREPACFTFSRSLDRKNGKKRRRGKNGDFNGNCF
jgi:hypothetical protein